MSGQQPSQRQLKVGENVRHALTNLIQRGDINDPDLEGVVLSVTEVRMSPDLKIATAFITAFGHDDLQPLIKALARNAKFIRGQLSRELGQMKYMPDFRFRVDDSFDNFERINTLLQSEKVRKDVEASGDDE